MCLKKYDRIQSTMLPKKIVFIDVETTGMRFLYDRIIEIGILRVENNKCVKKYTTLINPHLYLPPDITTITGITPQELENAPTFKEIKDTILELIEDCTMVAHNVRFDYSFLKNEFKRVNTSFSPAHFCTVKLSQFLFPHVSHHNLDSIIRRFSIPCKNRHRAFDDAAVLWKFYKKIQKQLPLEIVETAVSKALKRPSLPSKISEKTVQDLPVSSGVYLFYGSSKQPLYIGKSKNIKERILSHFSQDHSSPTEMKISQQIESIETITTPGELGALFRESQLIKQLQPLYNRKLRLKKLLCILKYSTTEKGYYSVTLEELTSIEISDLENIYGIFRSKRQAKTFLIEVANKHMLCEKLLGLEHSSSFCFGYRLGKCKGACMQKEKSLLYNMRFIIAFSKNKVKPWPFPGTIVIEEYNPLENKKELLFFDKWCYLGSVLYEEDLHTIVRNDISFDIDTYAILNQHLNNPHNLAKVKIVPSQEFLACFKETPAEEKQLSRHLQSSL